MSFTGCLCAGRGQGGVVAGRGVDAGGRGERVGDERRQAGAELRGRAEGVVVGAVRLTRAGLVPPASRPPAHLVAGALPAPAELSPASPGPAALKRRPCTNRKVLLCSSNKFKAMSGIIHCKKS